MPNEGYNVMYPFSWLQTAGDSTGDTNFQSVNMPEGDFFTQTIQSAGQTAGAVTAHVIGAWSPTSGMHTTGGPVDATYSGYINAAMMNPGNQNPVAGTPALMVGNANTGPVAYSDYANGNLPVQYVSPMPPWKNAPMQEAHMALPAHVQAQAAAAAVSSAIPQNTHQAMRQGGSSSGGCAGCNGGGCGGGTRSCKGRNPPLGLDSTNDFQPLYSEPTANAAQAVGAYLYANTSAKHQAWTVSQGAPADGELPLQGH